MQSAVPLTPSCFQKKNANILALKEVEHHVNYLEVKRAIRRYPCTHPWIQVRVTLINSISFHAISGLPDPSV